LELVAKSAFDVDGTPDFADKAWFDAFELLDRGAGLSFEVSVACIWVSSGWCDVANPYK
jgi:hypothetical protein